MRLVGLALLALLGVPASSLAQVEAEPVLAGRVLLGDSALPAATVVLHRMSEQTAGEVDSMRAAADGSFAFALPSVPNQTLGEFYLASVRHHGVMYFGPAIEAAVQLDSVYLIEAYDTLMAPDAGVDVALQSRSIFLEPTGEAWQATDVFYLRNDRDRTVVARPGGRVWSYPLPAEAREVMTGEGEFVPGVVAFEDGAFVVRAALPPGERVFVVRYVLDSPAVTIPSPGQTELFDLLVREPAPPLDVDPMQQVESVALEAGQTFRRYAAENLASPAVTITQGEVSEPPPVHWIAVVLALVLTGGALLALRARPPTPRAAVAADDRRTVLVQLARLDEEFERRDAPTPAQRREYLRRRAELLRQLQPGG
ncbi:MAG TPA: hypothetical protein VMM35_07765 [Longimicrobiales bacterium]|nr:hypothetical protein [Longimicrobiales bacterium]